MLREAAENPGRGTGALLLRVLCQLRAAHLSSHHYLFIWEADCLVRLQSWLSQPVIWEYN